MSPQDLVGGTPRTRAGGGRAGPGCWARRWAQGAVGSKPSSRGIYHSGPTAPSNMVRQRKNQGPLGTWVRVLTLPLLPARASLTRCLILKFVKWWCCL